MLKSFNIFYQEIIFKLIPSLLLKDIIRWQGNLYREIAEYHFFTHVHDNVTTGKICATREDGGCARLRRILWLP